MDHVDFARLIVLRERWNRYAGWADVLERFAGPQGYRPSLKWKYAYWMGAYTAVILAQSFLAERGLVFEVAYDRNDPAEPYKGWVILTDYEALE
jgi:hypothetical protein